MASTLRGFRIARVSDCEGFGLRGFWLARVLACEGFGLPVTKFSAGYKLPGLRVKGLKYGYGSTSVRE